MRLNKSAPYVDELFEELNQHSNAPHISKCAVQPEVFQFPGQICSGSIQRWRLRPGLDLMIHDLEFREQALIKRNNPVEMTAIGMSFCVAGQMRIEIPQATQTVQFQAGQASLGVVNDIKGSVEYAANQPISLIHLHVQPAAISLATEEGIEQLPSQLQKAIIGIDRSYYHQACTMTAVMKATVKQLLNCPYQGLTKRLYLESKTLELISLYFDQLLSSDRLTRRVSSLKADDIDRIVYARDILLSQVANPPGLQKLARQIGLNERKLKQGFRQVFGTTVFGYLRNYRMQQAQQLLLMPGATIASVAQTVGYSNPEAFSVAFRRAFAIGPKAYQLQQR